MAWLFLWSVKGVDAMVWGGLMRDCLGARGRVSRVKALELMIVCCYGLLTCFELVLAFLSEVLMRSCFFRRISLDMQ